MLKDGILGFPYWSISFMCVIDIKYVRVVFQKYLDELTVCTLLVELVVIICELVDYTNKKFFHF